MSKNKLWIMFIVLFFLTTVGGIVFFLLNSASGAEKNVEKLTSKEMSEFSYQTEEMNTDLEDGSFVRIQFQIVTENEEAKKEVEHRSFQFKNMLIKDLASIDREEFKTGLADLEVRMKEKLNEVMEKGKVVDVYTINKVLQ